MNLGLVAVMLVLAEKVKGVFEEKGYDEGGGVEALDLEVVGEEREGGDGRCVGWRKRCGGGGGGLDDGEEVQSEGLGFGDGGVHRNYMIGD